jgi:EPS-associated MarR family transcriptional regulator
MKKKKFDIDPDIHFRVLQVLNENPQITQRELSKELGISLGSINYCIRALIKVGHIKINNFRTKEDKSTYFYLITPQGISEKAKLTTGFLKRKIHEYHALQMEIEKIQSQLRSHK